MKIITLNHDKETIVDDDDYEFLSQFKWHVIRNYAKRGKDGMLMHRVIMGLGKGDQREVDHINGNRLDNRRCNLRICDSVGNNRNCSMQKNNKSGYKGVRYYYKGKWRAEIQIFGRTIHLGCFADKKDAARAYNEAAKKYFGEFARLNVI